MFGLIYNIPARRLDAYREHNVIIRSSEPAELVDSIESNESGLVRFLQLLSSRVDGSLLEGRGQNLPIEIVLKNPSVEYVELYKYSTLLDTHPVRIAVPVVPGFSKAVKAAISLNFAVKLEIEQPDLCLIEELLSVLDLYLHRSHVRQPIEFFQTMLQSFYRHEPVSLWEVAEEDPHLIRYITDDGEPTISRRFDGVKVEGALEEFVERFTQELLSERRECYDCQYFSRCGGYFKWPDKTYKCTGIKKLFRALEEAADELKKDLATYDAGEGQQRS